MVDIALLLHEYVVTEKQSIYTHIYNYLDVVILQIILKLYPDLVEDEDLRMIVHAHVFEKIKLIAKSKHPKSYINRLIENQLKNHLRNKKRCKDNEDEAINRHMRYNDSSYQIDIDDIAI